MADDGRREIWATLEPSTFRGIPWFVESISVSGGRKAFEKPILNSDEQIVDDIGLRQRMYSVRGYITAKYRNASANNSETLAEIEDGLQDRARREAQSGQIEAGPSSVPQAGSISADYREMRLLLTTAFEIEGAASLVHPIEGEIRDLICKEFTIEESMSQVGIGRVSAVFVRETVRPIPFPISGARERVNGAADAVDIVATQELADIWSTDNSFVNSISSAADKLTEGYQTALRVAEVAETATDAMDKFQRDIAGLEADVFQVVRDGISVADSIKGVFSSLNGLFPLPAAAFAALQNGFDFGDTDLDIDVSAPSGAQRKQNFDALNASVLTQYLSGAYRAALGMEYVTVDDVALVEMILEDQHQVLVSNEGVSDCLKDALEDLRESFFDFLADARLNARAVVTSETTTTTPRVLAYSLYESDSDTRAIAGLNGVRAYALLSGEVMVLSR